MALYCKWWQEGQYSSITVNTVISQQEGHRFKPTSWLDPLSMYRLHVNLVAVFSGCYSFLPQSTVGSD